MFVENADKNIEKYDSSKYELTKPTVIYVENIHIVQHLEILIIYQTYQKSIRNQKWK